MPETKKESNEAIEIKSASNETRIFFTDSVAYSSVDTKDERKYYVEGYISTKDRDLVDDIVTENCLNNMLKQIQNKSIKLDVEHEAWRLDNPTIIPVGRIVEAKKDERGIFVKAELNKANSRFTELWGSIKQGMVDAFSIAYKAKDYVYRIVDGVKTRLLNDIELLNVALTGNPVNREAKMTAVFMKSLDEIKQQEEKVAEEKAVEDKKEIEIKSQFDAKVLEIEQKAQESIKVIENRFNELEAKSKTLEESNKSLTEKLNLAEAEVKDLKAKLEAPVFKSEASNVNLKALANEQKSSDPLDAIK